MEGCSRPDALAVVAACPGAVVVVGRWRLCGPTLDVHGGPRRFRRRSWPSVRHSSVQRDTDMHHTGLVTNSILFCVDLS